MCIKLTEGTNNNLDFKSLTDLLSYSQPMTQLFSLKFEIHFLIRLLKNEKNGTNGEREGEENRK